MLHHFARQVVLVVTAIAIGRTPNSNRVRDDLAITHASVLDVVTRQILRNRTVTATNGVITAVIADGATPPQATRIIDARGRLLTPGFIDAHLHMCSIYAPACTNPRGRARHLAMTKDSIASYQRHMASLYLPYGVTSVRDVGSDEHLMPLLLAWMKRTAQAPDYYPVGADLISPDPNHTPAPWQVEVADSAAAAAKVREYHALGIRNIKLYWRLQEPAFRSAFQTAQALNMNVTAHVDFNIVPVNRALDLGVKNVEHMTAWAFAALGSRAINQLFIDVQRRIGTHNGQVPGFFYLAVPEEWNKIGPNHPKLLALIRQFKAANASVTPTLHVFAQPLGIAWFSLPPRDANEDASGFSKQNLSRALKGFRVMASYARRLHDAGVLLNIGTDTPEPGKSVLSEMLLLHEAGISMPDVFRIATLETARGIGHEADYGSVTVGKRANLILFDGNPLLAPRDLLGGKTVIKDGVVFALGGQN